MPGEVGPNGTVMEMIGGSNELLLAVAPACWSRGRKFIHVAAVCLFGLYRMIWNLNEKTTLKVLFRSPWHAPTSKHPYGLEAANSATN